MTKINRKLIQTLVLGSVIFAIAGFAINLLFPIPAQAILIDRSFCPPETWTQVVQQYDDLYRQHQQGQIRMQPVIVFSDLGEETLSPTPTSDKIKELSTYGRSNSQRQQQLQSQYPNAQLLKCPAV